MISWGLGEMEETPAAYDRGSEIGVEKACYASGSVSPGSFFASFFEFIGFGHSLPLRIFWRKG